nr:hypothetical protein [uncultured Lachnoanaerobaculum sp.]
MRKVLCNICSIIWGACAVVLLLCYTTKLFVLDEKYKVLLNLIQCLGMLSNTVLSERYKESKNKRILRISLIVLLSFSTLFTLYIFIRT